jgi:hypothetical protein
MVDRRTTLLTLLGAGFAYAAISRVLEAEAPAPAAAAPQSAAPTQDPVLQQDLATLGSHEYSDEGIPVLLACVNLIAEQKGEAVPPPTEFSRHFAAELRRYGDAWQHMHPDAPDTDVSKVIEVLAVRDFAHGAKGGAV